MTIEQDLIKFNENITKVSKEIVKYQDEKGNIIYLAPTQLLCSVEYKEATKMEYEQLVFQKAIDKTLEYNKIDTTKVVDKSVVTHNKKDQGTLIDSQVKAYQIWIVKNALGISKSFNDKNGACKLVEELNNKYLEIADLK